MIFIIVLMMLIKPIFPVVEYVVNYDYISKVLCENKAKPMMHCNGKCHLMKELAKASDAENPKSSDKKTTTQQIEVLYFEEIKSFKINTFYTSNKEKANQNYSNLYFYLDSDAVFRPPIFIS
ncbi:hypothetical protein [Flavobacterium sp.]|uniref:hypothetical protein n=1 Tax=Flavobacterium sp. TaxID=239 RepID=UPI002C081A2C|nr:hypothetical protein [Flavobacterium sp.]HSD08746.1 hypothetical protein [Flavobacterium sp.]